MSDREYRSYRNTKGGTALAHVVTEGTEGEVLTVNGVVKVLVGDVILQSQNVYYGDVVDAAEFLNNYSPESPSSVDVAQFAEDPRLLVSRKGCVAYDPSVKTAKEVAEYLSSVESEEDYNRVYDAEVNGKNRQSALVTRDWNNED